MPMEGPDDEENNQKWKHPFFSSQPDIKRTEKTNLELGLRFVETSFHFLAQ